MKLIVLGLVYMLGDRFCALRRPIAFCLLISSAIPPPKRLSFENTPGTSSPLLLQKMGTRVMRLNVTILGFGGSGSSAMGNASALL